MDQLFDPADILDRSPRQFGPGPCPGSGLGPAFQFFVDRRAAGLLVGCRGQIVHPLPVQIIAHADFQGLEPVQHIQLGQRNARHAAGGTGLPHQHRIEPAAAPLAPGHGAEFTAPLAQPFAIRIVQFGRERAFTYAGGIGLDDPQHEINRGRTHACPGRRLPCNGVRAGDIGVSAIVDVQKRPLRALEKDALSRAPRLGQHFPHRTGIGPDLRGNLDQLRLEGRRIDRLQPQPGAQRIVMRKKPPDPQVERCFIKKVCHPDRAAANLVFIGRTDAAPGGADLGHAGLRLAAPVQLAMDRQDQAGVFRKHQVFRADLDALPAQLVDLHDQMPRVHDHAVADDRKLAAPHDPAGQK